MKRLASSNKLLKPFRYYNLYIKTGFSFCLGEAGFLYSPIEA